MKSFYTVDGINFTSEVTPNKQELIVKVQLPEQEINFQKTEWHVLTQLLPKHVIRFIEYIIKLETNVFIKRTPSVN